MPTGIRGSWGRHSQFPLVVLVGEATLKFIAHTHWDVCPP